MVLNWAAASCLIVPGKSLAIISLTGQVWHPMGMPSGSARSCSVPAETNPAAAVYVAALFRKSLLEITDIDASSLAKSVPSYGTRGFCRLSPGTAVPGFHVPPLRGWNATALNAFCSPPQIQSPYFTNQGHIYCLCQALGNPRPLVRATC